MIAIGTIEGMVAVGQEGILLKSCDKESYGTDIGLLLMGLNIGEASSLVLSGFLIKMWGFAAPFILSAATYMVFFVGSYMNLEEKRMPNQIVNKIENG